MRILLLGADGQLGFELRGPLGCVGELTAVGRECDIASDALGAVVEVARPALVVNAAAYTDVDGAEDAPEAADAVNHRAVRRLGEMACAHRFGLIHVSTDFVFDGRGRLPYREDDAPAPINAYGKSKLAGERALIDAGAPALILRTAWVYGLRRKSFVATILRLAAERALLRVVADQLGNPTFCRDLASGIAAIAVALRADPFAAARHHRGVYHLAGSGVASRHELATAAVALHPRRALFKAVAIEPIASSALPLRAIRPAYTALDCHRIQARFGVRLPDWRDALARALAVDCVAAPTLA